MTTAAFFLVFGKCPRTVKSEVGIWVSAQKFREFAQTWKILGFPNSSGCGFFFHGEPDEMGDTEKAMLRAWGILGAEGRMESFLALDRVLRATDSPSPEAIRLWERMNRLAIEGVDA